MQQVLNFKFQSYDCVYSYSPIKASTAASPKTTTVNKATNIFRQRLFCFFGGEVDGELDFSEMYQQKCFRPRLEKKDLFVSVGLNKAKEKFQLVLEMKPIFVAQTRYI